MKKTTRTLSFLALLGLAVIPGTWGVHAQEQRATESTKGVRGKPSTSEVVQVLDCYVNFMDKRTIAASRAGILAYVEPTEGDEVKADQQVAKVKDEVATAQFATAHKEATNDVEIRYAKKAAEVAQAAYLKAVNANVLQPNAFTDLEVKRLKLDAERATLQIEQAQLQFEVNGLKRDEAGEVLTTHAIKTPIAGEVTKLYKRAGEAVREGDPILEVVNVDRMKVEGYVRVEDVGRIKRGSYVRVRLDLRNIEIPEENEVLEGRITFIDPAMKKLEPLIKIHAEVINTKRILRDGASAAMVIYPEKTFSGVQQAATRAPATPNTAKVD